jgi:hypothetical protein
MIYDASRADSAAVESAAHRRLRRRRPAEDGGGERGVGHGSDPSALGAGEQLCAELAKDQNSTNSENAHSNLNFEAANRSRTVQAETGGAAPEGGVRRRTRASERLFVRRLLRSGNGLKASEL